ncbi:MAG: DUF202 domain-containing protein [Nanoarchaeota archaeon]
MGKKSELLAEQRTHLAQIRTELAYKRTINADLRTSATMILFGIAFIGFSKDRWDFFFISGICAIIVGIIFIVTGAKEWVKHSNRIQDAKEFFEKLTSSKKDR